MRVAVLGCGIVGASVGWHLARSGVDVTLFDAALPGAGVSYGSFAWLNASSVPDDAAYFRLRVAALDAWRTMQADLDGHTWWHPTGRLCWADSQIEVAELLALAERVQQWDYPVEVWPTERVREILEPGVRFPAEGGHVLFFPGEGWMDPRLAAVSLLGAAIGHGASGRMSTKVATIVVSAGRVRAVHTADGDEVEVDAVVNATGPDAPVLAAGIGRLLPMRVDPGVIARVRQSPVPIRRVMHSPRVELRPDGPDMVLLHSREIDELIARGVDGAELGQRLLDVGCDVVPALVGGALVDVRVSSRPIPGDGLPSVGGWAGAGGYYEAVTHSGVTLSAILGRLLCREILSGEVDPLVAQYRPDRFDR